MRIPSPSRSMVPTTSGARRVPATNTESRVVAVAAQLRGDQRERAQVGRALHGDVDRPVRGQARGARDVEVGPLAGEMELRGARCGRPAPRPGSARGWPPDSRAGAGHVGDLAVGGQLPGTREGPAQGRPARAESPTVAGKDGVQRRAGRDRAGPAPWRRRAGPRAARAAPTRPSTARAMRPDVLALTRARRRRRRGDPRPASPRSRRPPRGPRLRCAR